MDADIDIGPVELVTAATTYPVDEEELKAALRLDADDANTSLVNCIADATDFCQRLVPGNRTFMTTTYDLPVADWWDELEMPLPPLVSVTWVKYYDADDSLQTLSSSNYLVRTPRNQPGVVEIFSSTTLPNLGIERRFPISVRFIAGWANRTLVPGAVRRAVTMVAVHFFENPEPVVATGAVPQELKFAVGALLDSVGWGSYA